ncbi:MAG: TIGR03936 family radical SAM-associated protein [Bacillota bacterium]|nr:TIGR03936 family radical SAM-associated protein [Bacillota bacterium]
MSKYILKFHKGEGVKYVSHLDIIRVFDRAVRRANLPMEYSGGFNPHPMMTFANSLGVGVASIGELVEITMQSHITEEEFKTRLNEKLPEGFEIEAVKELEGKNNFARLALADYIIRIEGEFPEKSLEEIFNGLPHIIVEKKTKSGVRETDIKPLVADFKETEKGVLGVCIKTGAENLKPELLVRGLEKYEEGFKTDKVVIMRTALLDEQGEPLFENL